MKLNKIKKAVIKEKRMTIIEDGDGAQWVGVPAAVYSLDGMPHMHDGQICRVLGISAEEAASFSDIKHYSEFGLLAKYNDADDVPPAVKDMDDAITINDTTLVAVTDENGRTLFFNPGHIAPVAKADVFRLAPDDNLLVYEGLFLTAIICPVQPGEDFTNRMHELYEAMI